MPCSVPFYYWIILYYMNMMFSYPCTSWWDFGLSSALSCYGLCCCSGIVCRYSVNIFWLLLSSNFLVEKMKQQIFFPRKLSNSASEWLCHTSFYKSQLKALGPHISCINKTANSINPKDSEQIYWDLFMSSALLLLFCFLVLFVCLIDNPSSSIVIWCLRGCICLPSG